MKKSSYITEIIKDITINAGTWKRYKDKGLQKGNIIIRNCGNGHKFLWGWSTSIAEVVINGEECTALTRSDKYRIEETFIWWMRNASLLMVSNK